MATKKTEETVEKVTILPIAHDFLREDMNELRDRVNQLIGAVNNL